jgi:transketolase
VGRPGDANETAAAWRIALERDDGPVALMLSRQNVEVLDRDALAGADGTLRGAYVLWESAPDPQLILIATGAELGPTLHAGERLAQDGTPTRVVSMPCMELFEAQDQAYRDEVLPPGVRLRLAVEPGVPMSWWKWVGDSGDVLGLDRFGASAPGTTVLEKLGFNEDGILERARALLARDG